MPENHLSSEMRAKIEEYLESEIETLKNSRDSWDIAKAQGACGAFKIMLDMPEQLEFEASNN